LTISIRLSPEMRDKLQQLADREERTLSQFCMRILRDYLRGLDEKQVKDEKKAK